MTQTVDILLGNNDHLQVEVQADESEIARLPRDLPVAWREADQAGATAESLEERGHAIGQQCRCALIVTSLVSLADRFPADLLVALVQQGTLPVEEALLWIRYKMEPKEGKQGKAREDSLLELAPLIPSGLWPGILDALQPLRLDTLTGLFPYLPLSARQEAKHKVFGALQAAHYWSSDRFLKNIVSFLSLDELRYALTIAGHLKPAANAEYKEHRADVLIVLLPRLAQLGFGDEAQTILQTISNPKRRAITEVGIARYLPIADRTRLLLEASLAVASSKWDQIAVLTEVASQFAEMGNTAEARKIAEQITVADYRTVALAKIVKYFPDDEANEILKSEILVVINSDSVRGTVDVRRNLCRYAAPQLTKRGDIQAVFRSIGRLSSHDVVPVLRELVPELVNLGYGEQLLQNVLSEASWWHHSGTMAVLARYLPAPLNATAIQTAVKWKVPIRDLIMRSMTLTHLASQLPDDDTKRHIAVAAIRAVQEYLSTCGADGIELETLPHDLDYVLTELSSSLPDAIKQEMVDTWIAAVQRLAEFYIEIKVPFPVEWLMEQLVQFTPFVREPFRQQIVSEVLAHYSGYKDEEERSLVMRYGLAPYLPGSQSPGMPPKEYPVVSGGDLETALKKALQNRWDWGYTEALEGLIPSLLAALPAERYRLWQEMLPELTKGRWREAFLCGLGVLAPVIASLGGYTGVKEVAEAIIDVGKWFAQVI